LSGLFTADFFQSTYGFSPGVGGLVYLGLGVGFFLSSFSTAKFADRIYKYVSLDLPHSVASQIVDLFRRLKLGEKNGGVSTPEMRIPVLFFGSLFVPVGIL
jgi:hypothetical protein